MAQPAVQPATAPFTGAIGRYFEIALYLLVLTGFGTLASTGGLSLASVLLAGAAILVRGYLLATGHTLLLSARWTSRLILGYVVFFLLDYFVISGLFVQSVVHLVLFLLVVRLF